MRRTAAPNGADHYYEESPRSMESSPMASPYDGRRSPNDTVAPDHVAVRMNSRPRSSLATSTGPVGSPAVSGGTPYGDDSRGLSNAPIKRNRPPVQLEWKNLRFDVMVKKSKAPWARKTQKTVLHPMNGHVKPGEILAIMGPSGAGKTSLLNLLAQRELNYTGKVKVNGKKLPASFRNFSCFVEQDDVLHEHLTVYQELRYSAFLRLPSSMSIKEKLARVEEVIAILGLNRCRNTKVGSPGGEKGISGGERKRLSIAIEILKRPSLLFLDEPTSGMDSKTSLNIVKAVRDLARTGTTVIMTIHQPRSQIFTYFDQLLLLADGQVAYHGPAAKVDEHFTTLNPTYALPKGFNIADHIIDLVTRTTGGGKDSKDARSEDEERIAAILAYWKKNENNIHETKVPPVKNATDLSKLPKYSSNWIIQFFTLLARNMNSIMNNKQITVGKLLQFLVIILFLGTLYFRMDNNQNAVMDRMGLLFFLMLFQVMSSIFAILAAFPLEFKVFSREKSSRAYSTSAYYAAKVLAELPLQVFFPFLFGAIVYYIVGFNSAFERYVTFLVILISTALAGISLGELISVAMPRVELGLILGPIVILVLAIFSGFYITIENIPDWYVWIPYLSLFFWGYQALVINEFSDLTFYCNSDEFVTGTNICAITSGEQVKENFSMDHPWSYVWLCVGILWGIIIVLKVLGFIVLWARTTTWRATLRRHVRNKRLEQKRVHQESREKHANVGVGAAAEGAAFNQPRPQAPKNTSYDDDHDRVGG